MGHYQFLNLKPRRNQSFAILGWLLFLPSSCFLLFSTNYPALILALGCVILSQIITSVCQCYLKYNHFRFVLHIILIVCQLGTFIYLGELYTLKQLAALTGYLIGSVLMTAGQSPVPQPKDD